MALNAMLQKFLYDHHIGHTEVSANEVTVTGNLTSQQLKDLVRGVGNLGGTVDLTSGALKLRVLA